MTEAVPTAARRAVAACAIGLWTALFAASPATAAGAKSGIVPLSALSLTPTLVTPPESHPDFPLQFALDQAAPHTEGFASPAEARAWLHGMARRLERRIPDPFHRVELLRLVHTEAARNALDPELVLAVIEVESAFDRFAVSAVGARGLMQVMPFWKKELGLPPDDLFDPATNLRYGCRVLRRYAERSGGDLAEALARYAGLKWDYPDLVFRAMKTRGR